MIKSFARRVLDPLLLATILGAGAAIVWVLAFGWTTSIVTQLIGRSTPSKSLIFTVEGEPLLQLHNPHDYSISVYRTLDGQEVANPDRVEPLEFNGSLPGLKSPRCSMLYPYYLYRQFTQKRGAPAYWYLVHDGEPLGHAYFAGFDVSSKRSLGYIGLSGLSDQIPSLDKRFAIDTRLLQNGNVATLGLSGVRDSDAEQDDGIASVYVMSGESVYKVDLLRRSVSAVALPNKPIAVGNVRIPTPIADERRVIFKSRIAVRLPDRILLLNSDDTPSKSIALPESVRDVALTVYPTTGDESILEKNPVSLIFPTDIFWINGQSHVVRKEQVTLYPEDLDAGRRSAWGAAIVLPTPLPYALVYLVFTPLLEVSSTVAPDYRSALAASLSDCWPPLVTICLLSAALVVGCFRHHRCYEKTGGIKWAVFVLLFGVPGLVGYWLHRRWPTMERCGGCGATVPRDRLECLACAAEFPAPVLKGIEVFA